MAVPLAIEKQKKALEATNDPRLVEIMTEQLNNKNTKSKSSEPLIAILCSRKVLNV